MQRVINKQINFAWFGNLMPILSRARLLLFCHKMLDDILLTLVTWYNLSTINFFFLRVGVSFSYYLFNTTPREYSPKSLSVIAMFPSIMHNPNTFPSVFLLVLLTLLTFPIFSNSQIPYYYHYLDPNPGPRIDHCAFAYDNRFYVFGGVGNGNNSYFSYINTPFNITDPKWNSLPVTNAKNVSRPACSVTSNGILYVTGEGDPSDNEYAGIQSFDLNKNTSGSWHAPTPRD